MIYTGESALDLGLIDEVGGLEAAKAKARELAGVSADMPVEDYRDTCFWDDFFGIRAGGNGLPGFLKHLGSDPLMRLSQGMYLSSTLRDLVMR
jgi:ClpP class serine protease